MCRGEVVCGCTFRANDWIYAISNSTAKGYEGLMKKSIEEVDDGVIPMFITVLLVALYALYTLLNP